MRADTDWTDAAAKEILDEQVKRSGIVRRPDIAKIIAKHCPFKPDVAYVPLVPVEPGHIQDWASRCAGYIAAGDRKASVHRLASIITHFAEPIVRLLREAGRAHAEGCPREDEEDGDLEPDDLCTCGADAWNKRIDEALS